MSSPDFTKMSVEETQKHFDDLKKKHKARRRKKATQRGEIDIDELFKKLLITMEREIDKLMDMSDALEPMEPKYHGVVIDYAKQVAQLKKHLADEFRDMDPKELEKLANDD